MSDLITISGGLLSARISNQGGAIADAHFGTAPLLRPYAGMGEGHFDLSKAGSFPLVPFGNRVEKNIFGLAGTSYRFRPNTSWDAHYLHGDGWLLPWRISERTGARVVLDIESRGRDDTPYAFSARQRISIADEALSIGLEVVNLTDVCLPFGLGHHLFFPLTPQTMLWAPADKYWTEKEAFLPDARLDVPPELDFSRARGLPPGWINNGFEGWKGRAKIVWPETGLAADIEAGSPFSRYFLFQSDTTFEPDFVGDYFCFEPMTHTANGHNLADMGGLVLLEPGGRLIADLLIRPMALI